MLLWISVPFITIALSISSGKINCLPLSSHVYARLDCFDSRADIINVCINSTIPSLLYEILYLDHAFNMKNVRCVSSIFLDL